MWLYSITRLQLAEIVEKSLMKIYVRKFENITKYLFADRRYLKSLKINIFHRNEIHIFHRKYHCVYLVTEINVQFMPVPMICTTRKTSGDIALKG